MATIKCLPPNPSTSAKDLTSCPARVLNHLQARYIAGKRIEDVNVNDRFCPCLDFSENITFSSREEATEWTKDHKGYRIVNINKLDEFHNQYVLVPTAKKMQDGNWCWGPHQLVPVDLYKELAR